MMQLLIIKFVGWLRWLFMVISVQLAFKETVTDSVNLSADVAITCIGNLAVLTARSFEVREFNY